MEKLLKTKKDREQFMTWLAWLKSDVFTQGVAQLQGIHEYCCLGVACELLVPPYKLIYTGNKRIAGSLPEEQPNAPLWLSNLQDNFISRRGYGLTQLNDGFIAHKETTGYANVLHDFGRPDVKLTFHEIADLLYETYKDEL